MKRYFEEVRKMSFSEFVKYLYGENPEWYEWMAAQRIWIEDGGDPHDAVIPDDVKFPEDIDKDTKWW
jgi:hypothetical protein